MEGLDAAKLGEDLTLEGDVAIVGTRRGRRHRGGNPERRRTQRVVLIEEGPLMTSRDFRMRESEAYPELYQESAAARRATRRSTSCRAAASAAARP